MNERMQKLMTFYELDPEDTFCTYGIAMEYIKDGESDQAMDWLNKTLAIDADFAYAYFQKAKVLIGQGDNDSARDVLQAGIEAGKRINDTKAQAELRDLLNTIS